MSGRQSGWSVNNEISDYIQVPPLWRDLRRRMYRQAITLACLGILSQPQAPTLIEPHSCKNGDFGVADFQGFRKVEEK